MNGWVLKNPGLKARNVCFPVGSGNGFTACNQAVPRESGHPLRKRRRPATRRRSRPGKIRKKHSAHNGTLHDSTPPNPPVLRAPMGRVTLGRYTINARYHVPPKSQKMQRPTYGARYGMDDLTTLTSCSENIS